MYKVSEQFLSAIKSPNRKSYVYGTLTTLNGDSFDLNDSNIIKDSLYITNQCVNGNELCFGAVYAGECGMTINSDIDRFSLFGARIELNYSVELDGSVIGTMPLGVFFVDTPERIGSKIKLTAIDAMSNFDKKIEIDSNGTWYELVSYIALECGVELAQTQEELEALHTNTTSQSYTIMQEWLTTFRDALACLSMVICANATIDRNGRLKFVQFATSACDSNNRETRLNNCNFSDYSTRYAGITARFVAEQNYAPYSTVDENVDGLILDCGDIPIVGGTKESKHDTVDAMFETLRHIEYTPATLYIPSNPAYDLGDMLECQEVNNSNFSANVYVMCYKFEYRKKETVNCFGANPLMQNIKDQSQKLVASFENQISAKNLIIVNYTNASGYTIKQSKKDIVTLSYCFQQDCRPIILCTIPFHIDVDGYVEFKLYNGLIELDDATYTGYYAAGEHFASFMYLDNCPRGARQKIIVKARCYANINSATRDQEARIKTLENVWQLMRDGAQDLNVIPSTPDSTQPTVTVDIGVIKALAYTNAGAGGILDWNGVIECTEEFTNILTASPEIAAFIENVANGLVIPTSSQIADVFSGLSCTTKVDGMVRTWGELKQTTWGALQNTEWGDI